MACLKKGSGGREESNREKKGRKRERKEEREEGREGGRYRCKLILSSGKTDLTR